MLSRRNFQLFSTWTLYVLFICYTVSMNNDRHLLFQKVQADIFLHKEVIRNESDPALVKISRDLLKQNQAWLAEWQAQHKLTSTKN